MARGTRRLLWAGAATAVAALAGLVAPPPVRADHLPLPSGPRHGELLALTYNVAGLPEPLSGSEPDTNTPIISPLLNPYDVVLVQEDWIDPVPPIPAANFHHDDLIASATHAYKSTPGAPPLGTNPARPSAIIADGLNYLSRLPITDPPDRVMWPNCFGGANTSDGGAADCLAIKGFARTSLTLASGVVVDLYNLHGEAGSTALDQQYSAEDFEVLAAYVNEHSTGHAIILGGDTNLHTNQVGDGAVWDAFLAATGLHDVCEEVACGADDGAIDKFAFRSAGGIQLTPLTHTFERETFRRESDGEPLSDHDALSVRFAWDVAATTPDSSSTTSTTASSTPPTPPTPPSTGRNVAATPAVVAPRFTG